MTERERLIELFIDAKKTDPETGSFTEYLADYLLDNGVIVPPCKVGDTLYYEKDGEIKASSVDKITYETYGDALCGDVFTMICGYGYSVTFEDVGKLVFPTKEEAEKALKERETNV